jgi:uncharacterized protein (TIGR03437 family)
MLLAGVFCVAVQAAVIADKAPLLFEANRGQSDNRVKFLSRSAGYTMFFTSTGAVFSLHGGAGVRMKFEGGHPAPLVEGLEKQAGHISYFIGEDPAKWRSATPQYAKIRYRRIYEGIDLVYYGNQRQIESDFVVQPGADPSQIRLSFDGCKKLEINSGGELVLRTSAGELRLARPRVYQASDGERHDVAGGYVLLGSHTAGFTLGDYDRRLALVIDPVVYASLLGGSGEDAAGGIALDGPGNTYVTGFADSADFPANFGTPGPGVHGIRRVFVAKFNPSGSELIYSVLLGGSGTESSSGIAVDTAGHAYVSGSTSSQDFPRTPGAYDTFRGQQAGFVVKLNPSGTGLVYSALLGGAGRHGAGPVTVDAAGNAYVTAMSETPNDPPGFPTTAVFGSGQRAQHVVKLNAYGSGLLYASLVRGGYVNSIAVSESGNAYIAGGAAAGFPTTAGSFHRVDPPADTLDGFIAKLSPDGTQLAYSTFLDTPGGEVSGLAVDGSGSALVGTAGANSARVLRLNPEGSSLIFRSEPVPTYADINGGSTVGIALASSGEVWVSTVSPLPQPIVEIFKLSPTGSRAGASIPLFGSGSVYAAPAIRESCSGDVYLGGLFFGPSAGAFPATAGAFQSQPRGPIDAFIVRVRPDDLGRPTCTLHGASFRPGAPVAPESIVSLFGESLTASSQAVSTPQAEVAGAAVQVRDSQGVERQAMLYYASPSQINYLVPAGSAAGPATVSVRSAGEVVAVAAIEIAPVAPGIFAANAVGYGPAAAVAVRASAGAEQSSQLTFDCSQQPCVSTPFNLGGPEDQVVLLLFGTGIRGRSQLSSVSATVGGEPVVVQYAGPQNEFQGLDQVNLFLPRTLAGRGEVEVNLSVDERLANAVKVRIE